MRSVPMSVLLGFSYTSASPSLTLKFHTVCQPSLLFLLIPGWFSLSDLGAFYLTSVFWELYLLPAMMNLQYYYTVMEKSALRAIFYGYGKTNIQVIKIFIYKCRKYYRTVSIYLQINLHRSEGDCKSVIDSRRYSVYKWKVMIRLTVNTVFKNVNCLL